MAKTTYIQTSFVGGEILPRLEGRVDITKFKAGARTMENFTVLPHGGARKRSGTRHVMAQKSGTDDVALIPFQFNVEQSYLLLFGPGYVWFFKDQGLIVDGSTAITAITAASPPVVTAASHGLSNGDRVFIASVGGMVELNNRQFLVSGATTDTFELNGINATAFTAYTSGGSAAKVIELTTTYTAGQVMSLRFAQSADTLYIVHPDHPLRTITRSSHTSWTLSTPSITTGPFRTINSSRTLRITPSAFSGAATGYATHIVGETFTATASSGIFTPTQVGALYRFNEEGGSTGIESAPTGDTTRAIAANQSYTNEGLIYGVYAVSGAANWGSFTRVPSHDAGTVRVNGATGYYFDSDFLHPGYCIARVTAYTSATVVTMQIVRYQMPAAVVSSGTTFWEEGAWSDYRGYPAAVAFYEQRLFMAGSGSDPQTLWGSRSNAFTDFEDGTEDDSALIYRITAGSADAIRWLASGRVLTAGTSQGEFAISASSLNEALTPSNFKASPQTTYGTSNCPPVRINQSVLYPQRSGDPDNAALKLREFSYAYESDSFNSVDLTVFAQHITGSGFNRLAFQVEPDSIIWVCRDDGQLAACTYERQQEVIAWHRHLMGGDGVVETICSIPGATGDEVWLSVRRGLSRYVEVMLPAFADDGEKEDAIFVDASLSYDGAETSRLSGLWHLRGQEVQINSNGSIETQTVGDTGILELDNPTTLAHVGLAYTAVIETEDLEGGAQAGTAQSRAKRISQIFVRVLNSLGGTFGSDEDDQKIIYYRTVSMPHGSSPPLYSGLIELDFPAGWERFARVRIEHSDPLPCHITGIVAELNTQG